MKLRSSDDFFRSTRLRNHPPHYLDLQPPSVLRDYSNSSNSTNRPISPAATCVHGLWHLSYALLAHRNEKRIVMEAKPFDDGTPNTQLSTKGCLRTGGGCQQQPLSGERRKTNGGDVSVFYDHSKHSTTKSLEGGGGAGPRKKEERTN